MKTMNPFTDTGPGAQAKTPWLTEVPKRNKTPSQMLPNKTTEKMLHFFVGHKLYLIFSFPNLTYNQQLHSISIKQPYFNKPLFPKFSASALLGKKWKHLLWWHTSVQENNHMMYLIFLLSHIVATYTFIHTFLLTCHPLFTIYTYWQLQ